MDKTKNRSPADAGIMKDKVQREREDAFVTMNECPVDDISLDFFYKPHTITLLAVSIIGVMYMAFIR